MAGALVPAAGAIGADAVSQAQQEINFEDLASALRRMMGVGVGAVVADEILAGSITPSDGIVVVDTEGLVSADNLDQIDQTNYIEDSLILLRILSANRVVTVRNQVPGVGQIILSTVADFPMDSQAHSLLLRKSVGAWLEVGRFYGLDRVGERAFLGLGSVATLNDGAVDAATLQGNPAANFLLAAGVAADSALFAGLATAAFLRSDLASLQSIVGGLKAKSGVLQTDHPSAVGAPLLNFSVIDVIRSQVFYDAVNAELISRILAADQATVLGGLRVRDGQVPDYWDKANTQWSALIDPPGMGRIDWDKFDPVQTFQIGLSIVQSIALPQLTGTGANGKYRISAGTTLIKTSGSGTVNWTTRLYVGVNGDTTDALIAESVGGSTGNNSQKLDVITEEDYVLAVPSFITIVLNITGGSTGGDLHPSVQNAFTIEKKTYLRVEQIG